MEHPKEYDRETGETGWAAGACIPMPAELFHRAGGFDEAFFLYCEDVDLSWRLRLLGYRLLYRPACPVYHSKRLDSSGKFVPEKTQRYHSAVSDLILAHKWSNPALEESLLAFYRTCGDGELRRAAAEFKEKRKRGLLPGPIDPEHKVSRFSDGRYAKHRFSL